MDVDRNGCDTRNDMLKRDLTAITYTNSVPCKVQSGTLADPYTGTTISFLRGSATSSAVQIDHVVALSDAWQKGAQQLTTEQRTAFANDPLNLQSTDGPTNMKKGDGDAATWLPPNKGFRCEYVARQISVKATYSLWVTQAEHDAMARILADCAGQLAPTNEQAPVVAAPAPAPVAAAPVAPAPAAPWHPSRAGCSRTGCPGTGSCSAGRRLLRQLRGGQGRRRRTDPCRAGRLPGRVGPRRRRRGLRKLDQFHHSFQIFLGGKMKKTLALVVLTGLMLTGCGGTQEAVQPNYRCCSGLRLSRFQAWWA